MIKKTKTLLAKNCLFKIAAVLLLAAAVTSAYFVFGNEILPGQTVYASAALTNTNVKLSPTALLSPTSKLSPIAVLSPINSSLSPNAGIDAQNPTPKTEPSNPDAGQGGEQTGIPNPRYCGPDALDQRVFTGVAMSESGSPLISVVVDPTFADKTLRQERKITGDIPITPVYDLVVRVIPTINKYCLKQWDENGIQIKDKNGVQIDIDPPDTLPFTGSLVIGDKLVADNTVANIDFFSRADKNDAGQWQYEWKIKGWPNGIGPGDKLEKLIDAVANKRPISAIVTAVGQNGTFDDYSSGVSMNLCVPVWGSAQHKVIYERGKSSGIDVPTLISGKADAVRTKGFETIDPFKKYSALGVDSAHPSGYFSHFVDLVNHDDSLYLKGIETTNRPTDYMDQIPEDSSCRVRRGDYIYTTYNYIMYSDVKAFLGDVGLNGIASPSGRNTMVRPNVKIDTVIHEFGHLFADLLDETWESGVPSFDPNKQAGENQTYKNCSFDPLSGFAYNGKLYADKPNGSNSTTGCNHTTGIINLPPDDPIVKDYNAGKKVTISFDTPHTPIYRPSPSSIMDYGSRPIKFNEVSCGWIIAAIKQRGTGPAYFPECAGLDTVKPKNTVSAPLSFNNLFAAVLAALSSDPASSEYPGQDTNGVIFENDESPGIGVVWYDGQPMPTFLKIGPETGPETPVVTQTVSKLTGKSNNKGEITLSWQSDPLAAGNVFSVERVTTDDVSKVSAGTFNVTGLAHVNTYTDTGLLPNTVYGYRVRIQTAAGSYSATTNILIAQTTDDGTVRIRLTGSVAIQPAAPLVTAAQPAETARVFKMLSSASVEIIKDYSCQPPNSTSGICQTLNGGFAFMDNTYSIGNLNWENNTKYLEKYISKTKTAPAYGSQTKSTVDTYNEITGERTPTGNVGQISVDSAYAPSSAVGTLTRTEKYNGAPPSAEDANGYLSEKYTVEWRSRTHLVLENGDPNKEYYVPLLVSANKWRLGRTPEFGQNNAGIPCSAITVAGKKVSGDVGFCQVTIPIKFSDSLIDITPQINDTAYGYAITVGKVTEKMVSKSGVGTLPGGAGAGSQTAKLVDIGASAAPTGSVSAPSGAPSLWQRIVGFVTGNGTDQTTPPAVQPASNITTPQANPEQETDAEKDTLTLELDYPDYMPKYLRNPQKIFSGRKLRIIPPQGQSIDIQSGAEMKLQSAAGGATAGAKKLALHKGEENGLTANIPQNTPSGSYALEFKIGNTVSSLPIEVDGTAGNSGKSVRSLASVSPQSRIDPSVQFVKRICSNSCYWESISATNPLNPDYGYFFGGGASDWEVQTKDGWLTSTISHLNGMTDSPFKYYRGDPILAFNEEGKAVLASLLQNYPETITGGLYTENKPFQVPSSYNQAVLNPIPQNLNSNEWIIFDYPRIAIDTYPDSPYFKSQYVFANAVRFPDAQVGTGLFAVRNGAVSIQKSADIGFTQPPQSAIVGPGGVIYIGSRYEYPSMSVFTSTDGGKSFNRHALAATNNSYCSPRVSTQSNRATLGYPGPALASDSRGRIYAVWSDPKECIPDSNFEYPAYGYDFDVYESFSDDRGETWSTPVRVNDDIGSGNQYFPSIAVDQSDGSVYVAFLDHRYNQDKAQFDVYLAKSSDRGRTFSKNIRVNDKSVPLEYGGREPGDYLYMLSVGKQNVFVAHPCASTDAASTMPTDECVSAVEKSMGLGSSTPPIISDTGTLSGRAGDTITLTGLNFAAGDMVLISGRNISSFTFDATAIGTTTISFVIPKTFKSMCGGTQCDLSLPPGSYSIQVINSGEASNSAPLEILPALSSSIEITSPQANAVWEGYRPQTITWRSDGVARVKIENTSDPINGSLTPDGGIINRNSFVWTPYLKSGFYTLRISDMDNPQTFAETRIEIKTAIPAITEIIPSVGKPGDYITIKGSGFDTSKFSDKILRVVFSAYNDSASIALTTGSDNQIKITVPTEMNHYDGKNWNVIPIADGLYYVQVVTMPASSDSVYFTVSSETHATSTITVLSPSGETYKQGDIIPVRWQTQGIPPTDTLVFDILNSDRQPVRLLDNGLNTGTTTVSAYDTNALPPGQYYLRIRHDNDPKTGAAIYGISNSPFTITAAAKPLITITSPADGQRFFGKAGTSIDVKWKTENWDSNALVNIELLNDADGSSVTVGSNQKNTGEFKLNVNRDSTIDKTYRLRVSAVKDVPLIPGETGLSQYFSVIVPGSAPIISSFTGPSVLKQNQSGVWSLNAESGPADLAAYEINWGDGSGPSVGTGSLWPANASHSYKKSGAYAITATVIDWNLNEVDATVYLDVSFPSATSASVNAPPAPYLLITASPNPIKSGETPTIRWSSNVSGSCASISNNFDTKYKTGATAQGVAQTAETIYTISCRNPGGGAVTDSVTVPIDTTTLAPTGGNISAKISPTAIRAGATVKVTVDYPNVRATLSPIGSDQSVVAPLSCRPANWLAQYFNNDKKAYDVSLAKKALCDTGITTASLYADQINDLQNSVASIEKMRADEAATYDALVNAGSLDNFDLSTIPDGADATQSYDSAKNIAIKCIKNKIDSSVFQADVDVGTKTAPTQSIWSESPTDQISAIADAKNMVADIYKKMNAGSMEPGEFVIALSDVTAKLSNGVGLMPSLVSRDYASLVAAGVPFNMKISVRRNSQGRTINCDADVASGKGSTRLALFGPNGGYIRADITADSLTFSNVCLPFVYMNDAIKASMSAQKGQTVGVMKAGADGELVRLPKLKIVYQTTLDNLTNKLSALKKANYNCDPSQTTPPPNGNDTSGNAGAPVKIVVPNSENTRNN